MSEFGKAFNAARKSGKKVFTFNGKKYNTKLAADTPKKAPIPSAAPRGPKSGKPTKAPPKQSAAGGRATTATKQSAPGGRATKSPAKSGAQPSRAAANAQERRYKNDDIRSFRKRK